MALPLPDFPFYCPVCERAIVFIWIWRQPGSGRVRMFCDACAHLPEYHVLPKEEMTILSYEGFQRFAAERILRHVLEKERLARQSA
jgi:hypothetical protein